ncbi:HAD-IB family hydrolase [Kordia jejudonensis]|uniref:HAD-IB family hydrolase n=1 Tax=Kordia jejudonensis TaxID=1348245 RepID=UPI0006296D08|nr:HAD-IB family hydrolase [Kordia jejudonensis]
MSKKLYLFDYDGTLTHKDSFKDFFLKMYGFRKVSWLLLSNSLLILKTILADRDKGKLKETLISIFLKGKTKVEIDTLGKAYTKEYLYRTIRPKALEYLYRIRKEGATMYLVSASIDFWLQTFADELHMKLIATQLAYENGTFTGQFLGKNCKGAEKVKRITQEIHLADYDEIIAFGNSEGDKEMLAIATESHYKPFRKK